MMYLMFLSLAVLGTAKAFAPTPRPFFISGTTYRGTKRLASTWFSPMLKRQAVPSYYQKGFLHMNFLSDVFYDLRANSLGFATKEEVKAAASNPKSVFLDVRSQAEIDAGSLDVGKPVIYATCTSADTCPALTQLPKNKGAPVIVFCASGKRASVAKQVLESEGYTKVLNAGGLGDLDYL
jgi:rhodanese-related sulfurtransferase